jgi:hypothetical protein
VRLRVTTRVMKTVDKYGGLDNFLIRTPLHKLNSKVGMYWRYQILETLKARLEAYRQEAAFRTGAQGLAAAGAVAGTATAAAGTAAAAAGKAVR